MIYKEIEGALVMFTLMTGVAGLGELSVGNVRPGPVLVVRDGVGVAYMGRPFASYPLRLTELRERNQADPLRSQ